MSASEVPAWRCKFPGCEHPLAFDSRDRCYYHGKLEALPILDGYNSRANASLLPRASARTRYPWDSWLDGRPHTLVAGTDYATNTPNMVRAARSAAKRLGVAVVLTPTADSLTIQAALQDKKEGAA